MTKNQVAEPHARLTPQIEAAAAELGVPTDIWTNYHYTFVCPGIPAASLGPNVPVENVKMDGADWTAADADTWGAPWLQFNMDNRPPVRFNNHIPGGLSIPHGYKVWTERGQQMSTADRGAAWGLKTSPSDLTYSTNCNMNLMINGVRYLIPNLWLDSETYMQEYWARWYSNWNGYGSFSQIVEGSQMTVYAYRDGNVNYPVVLQWRVQQGFIHVSYVRDILHTEGSMTAWQDEFAWRLAATRLNFGAYYTGNGGAGAPEAEAWTSGVAGWVGKMGPTITSLLVAPEGTHLPSFTNKDVDIIINTQEVVGDVKEVYVSNIASSEVTPVYAQEYSLVNQTKVTEPMKTSDYSWQVADQSSFKWGMKEQIAVKCTLKWEAELDASFIVAKGKSKYSLQWDFGYTQEFTQEWTSTHTETRTWTFTGQTVSVPGETALHVDHVVSRVRATGTLGHAIQLSMTPGIYAIPMTIGSHSFGGSFQCGVNMAKAAELFGMKSIAGRYRFKDGPNKGTTVEGAFIQGFTDFETQWGVSGQMLFSEGTYVPPAEGAIPDVFTMRAFSGGK